MTILPLPLSFFVDKLNAAEPFSFARYGDGEFSAILGEVGENADHHQYFPGLGAELRQTLVTPRAYMHALGPKARHRDGIGPDVANFLAACPPVEWYTSETFLTASLQGKLYPLVEALGRLRVVMVGPAHLRQLPITNVVAFVEVPLANCWLEKARIEHDILREAYKADVIAFSAGMATNVMIYDLFPHLGGTHALIDFGSLWDVMVGVDSRRYARRMTADMKRRMIEANLSARVAA